MGFLSISFAQSADTWFALQTGFEGISFVPQAVSVFSVSLADYGGTVNTFQITNASLQDASGTMPDYPLAFAPQEWTAADSVFYYGLEPDNIRIKFDIAGITLTGAPFSIVNQVIVPVLTLI